MTSETHFDCPICNEYVLVEEMKIHFINHINKKKAQSEMNITG